MHLKECIFDDFSGGRKLEDACDLYIRAGNAFKMAKNWSGMASFHYLFFQNDLPNFILLLL